MRQLPTQSPTPPPGVSQRDYPTRRWFVDPIDIFRQYDAAVVELFRIPLIQEGVRLYDLEELQSYSVQKLREIAGALNVNNITDNKELLIKAIRYGQQIPVVFASPSPAYSAQELVTGRREGSIASSNTRYPIISIQRTSVNHRPESFNRSIVRKISWIANDQAVIQGFRPNGISLTYQVECLATLQTHSNMMDSYVYRLWNNPVARIEVDLGEPWGIRPIHVLHNSAYQDATDYEMDASVAEKMVRHIHTIEVEGWIPTPVWLTPTILRFRAGYYDLTTGQLLEGGEQEILNR